MLDLNADLHAAALERMAIEEEFANINAERVAELEEIARLRAENERLRAALNEIWLEVKGGAYQGVDYSPQIGRIKGICLVVQAALAGKERSNG